MTLFIYNILCWFRNSLLKTLFFLKVNFRQLNDTFELVECLNLLLGTTIKLVLQKKYNLCMLNKI